MEIRSPETEAEFNAYFYLRWKILRQGWGQAQGSEQDKDESTSFHIIAIVDHKIRAVARLQKISEQQMQLRYMAVDKHLQNQGIGKAMMLFAEKHARESASSAITLHTREDAMGFYLHIGYQKLEKSYLLFDCIQHYKMIKYL